MDFIMEMKMDRLMGNTMGNEFGKRFDYNEWMMGYKKINLMTKNEFDS